MTFLERKRSIEGYLEKLSTKSSGTREHVSHVVRLFDKFCIKKYSHDSERVIEELLSMDMEDRERAGCDVCQDWVNYMHGAGKAPRTIHVYLSHVKGYLYYRGVRLTDIAMRNDVNVPKIVKEQKLPLSMQRIRSILQLARYEKRTLYLALLSSGMRIGEALQIRKRDIRYVRNHIAVDIPGSMTKTQAGRTVFISSEAATHIAPRLRRIEDDDPVWGTSSKQAAKVKNEDAVFKRYAQKLGYTETYDTGASKTTPHAV